MSYERGEDLTGSDVLTDGKLVNSSCSLPQKEEIHCRKVLKRVHGLREYAKLCDVILRCEGKEIPTHRAVLAACSPYFLAMFTHELRESSQQVVDLKDVNPEILSALVDFVYTGVIDISVQNVQEVLSVASLLQITEVMELCCSFLHKKLEPQNCLGIRNFAEAHGCQDLSNAIDRYAMKNFSEVAKSQEFLQHSCQNIEKLIRSSELCVNNEQEVFEAIVTWVKHDPEEREPMLPKLMKHVRFPLLPVKYLVKEVDSCDLVKRSLDCRDYVDEAKQYHLMPEERSFLEATERMVPRKSTVGTLFAVGGKESSESITRAVECYTL